jgi:glycosyltransferase involved in cell wall biosynthesis
VEALEELATADGPRVIFVGKLIVSKGVDLLVAAWPLIHRANPGARLLLVGFGAYEMGLRALVTALGEGDLDSARYIAEAGRELEGGEAARLDYLADFLSLPPLGYAEAARDSAGSVSFSGRLEHAEVARVLPACDAMVVPSTFPEAFGMVAAEGAASGVLPVCAEHSGLAEVTAVLADEVPAVSDLISFQRGPEAVADLGSKVNSWLGLAEADRVEIGRNIAESADRNWSWTGVANDVISASQSQIRPVKEP